MESEINALLWVDTGEGPQEETIVGWDAVLYWGDGSVAPLQAMRFKRTHTIRHFPIFWFGFEYISI